jgi:hypothetical protein
MKGSHPMLILTIVKPNDNAEAHGSVATWALAVAQLVSWGSIYYAFSLFVVPMEIAMGWSRTATNAALSIGLLVSGLAAYPVGAWIDHGHGRRLDRSRPRSADYDLWVSARHSNACAVVSGA